jgi:hypothetical protein
MTLSIDTPLPKAQHPGEPRFATGQLLATPGAIASLEQAGISLFDLLVRHVTGDWGEEVGSDDRQTNEAALRYGNRVMSAYRVGDVRIWAITEADRSATTFLLPEEY